MKTILFAVAVLVLAYVAAQPAQQYEDTELPNQTTDLLDDVIVNLTPSTYDPVSAPDYAVADNVRAFLDMLAYSEGTSGPDGYRTLFGGGLFESYLDHPRQYFPFTDGAGRTLKTSAAGRYQFLARTWDELAKKLGLADFRPSNQDAAALELIRQRGALDDVKSGRVSQAVAKCSKIWASLPGAGYSQPERKLASLLTAYRGAGGYLEA